MTPWHTLISGIAALALIAGAVQAQTPTPTPEEMIYPYTIAGLRDSYYPGGTIELQAALADYGDFSQHRIAYPSDGLTITGEMHLPAGDGPFPVVILLHGYYDRESYWSGLGTQPAAVYLVRQGYLTIAPDLRGWGESDEGINLFASGLVADTLNLISSLPSLLQADPEHVYLWGHSMGGGVATKVLAVDSRIDAAVLYAPNSANDADLIERWGAACLPDQSQTAGDSCNPSEVLPSNPILQAAYFQATTDPLLMQQIAPIYHLGLINTPIQIHIGTADGAQLSQTPPEWSATLYAGLVEAEREVSYFEYAGQGHFFTGNDWVLMMERTVEWFESH